jgi:hypothetical protein
MLEIGNALRRAGRENIALHSIIVRSICHIYGKDIIVQSIIIQWNKVIVRTWKSILNSELMLKNQDIKKESLTRLSKVWITISEKSIFLFI